MQNDVVDLGSEAGLRHKNGNRYKYEASLDYYVDRTQDLVLTFPFHPTREGKTLHASTFRNCVALNREISARRKASTRSDTFSIGKTQFINVVGNVYLVWAKELRKSNVNNIEVLNHENSLMLITKDGYGLYGAFLFIFDDNLKVSVEDCKIYYDARYAFYCLESDINMRKTLHVQVVHESVARDRVKNDLHDDLLDDFDDVIEDYSSEENDSDNDNNRL